MIEAFIKEKITSQMTPTPATKLSTDDLPHFLKVWRYYESGYAENAFFLPAISKSTLSDKNVNEIYTLTSGAGYNVKELRLYNKAQNQIFVKQAVDFDKLNNEDLTLNIYFTCKASGVQYELAKRLFKYFKDDFGLPVLNAKLISLYYNRYNGSTPAGSGSVAIAGGEVLTDKSYKQKICIYNSTALTMKEFKIMAGYEGIELINIDKILNTSFIMAPNTNRVIILNINIDIVKDPNIAMFENLVTNGDFSNGTTGWGASVVPLFVENNSLKLHLYNTSGTRVFPNARQSIQGVNGNIYYVVFDVTNDTSGATAETFFQFGSQIVFYFKGVGKKTSLFTANNNATLFYFNNSIPNNVLLSANIDNVLLLNLTQIFGAGNEPTKAEMDVIINRVGWFNGFKSIKI